MHQLLHWGDQLNWLPIVCLVIASVVVLLMRMLIVWFFARRLSAVRGSSEAQTATILTELLATQKPIVPSVVSNPYFLSGVVLILVTLWGLVSTAWWMLPLGCLSWVLVHRPFLNEMQAWSQMQSNRMALEDAGVSSEVIQKTINEVVPLNEVEKKETFEVINCKAGRFVLIDLPSRERILISIGSATVKIIDKSAKAGWFIGKTVASERLDKWQPEYWKLNNFHRNINRNMILEGLLISLSQCRSLDDIRRVWPTMQNPILVLAKEKNY